MYVFLMSVVLSLAGELNARQNNVLEDEWNKLSKEAESIGKPEWRPMLQDLARLHKESTHPAEYPFDYEWEENGPGCVYGRAFGHWDVVHIILDVLPSCPQNALHQLLNDVKNQSESGFLPGVIWEFYNSLGGRPEDVKRKPKTIYNVPCKDYLGHNPLIAMARLYDYASK